MNGPDRRVFVLQVAAGSALLLAAPAFAQPAMVGDKDPTALALGYTPDTNKVDPKKFPKHAAAQKCSNCQLYTGRPGDATGGCGIFTGKLVVGNGWCSAYLPKV